MTVTVLFVPLLGGGAFAAAAGSCDSWVGGSGMWSNASSWSDGVPGPDTDVCITASGTYTVEVEDLQNANSITLGGSSGTQTLVVVGNKSVESELTITSPSTVNANGELEVSSTGGGSSYLRDDTITNDGTFEAIGSGSITPDQIYTSITNEKGATVDIDDDSEFPLNGSVVANSGTFTIAKGATMLLEGPGTFTQSGGTLDVAGTLQTATGDVFNENGGVETGNPVDITNTTLKDSNGNGTFDLEGSGAALSGTVPRGQTLNLLGAPSDEETTLASPQVLNDGMIVLTSKAGNFAEITGAPLINAGRLYVEGAGQDELHSNITNEAGGKLDLTTPSPTQVGGALVNEGKLLLGSSAHVALNGGSIALRHGSTLDVTIATGSGPEITGSGTLSLGGTLEVTTVGSPKAGHTYDIVSQATPTGQFARLDFPKPSFSVAYSSTAVTLTVKAPLHAGA